MKRSSLALLCGIGAGMCLAVTGCKLLEMATSVGVATGTISSSQAGSINKAGSAVAKSFESIDTKQEYFIGRSVAAGLLKSRPIYSNATLDRYVNVLGQAIALSSDRPETYKGYHFLVLDSNDINAFAAPGGLILVTRGLLRCCKNEDDLAAVLAHEVAHVQFKHGLQAIGKSRVTKALTIIATEGAKQAVGGNTGELVDLFSDSLDDITQKMVVNGYGNKFEFQADHMAITILNRIGYDPNGLKRMLQAMAPQIKPGKLDFSKTHPPPSERIEEIEPLLRNVQATPAPAARQARFDKAMAGV